MGSTNLRPKIVLETREIQNCLAHIHELTPFSIQMDVNITILFVTFSLHVSIPEFVSSNSNATFTIAK
jgi:hypothetical protein